MAYHVASVSLQLIQGDNLSQLCVLRWLHGIIMSSLQASKLCLYKQFDVLPILKLLNTPYILFFHYTKFGTFIPK